MWTPDDDPALKDLLQRMITRAHETAAIRFRDERKHIAEEQAARGNVGGIIVRRGEMLATGLIEEFSSNLTIELLATLKQATGHVSTDALTWVKDAIAERVDGMARGFGAQLDEQRQRQNIPSGSQEALRGAAVRAKRDSAIEIDRLALQVRLLQPVAAPSPEPEKVESDVFISHASEDKGDIASPLAAALQNRGFRVWIDKAEITIGDRLMTKIDDGLRRSRFGVVIISPYFFAKGWTKWELNALAAVEASEGEKRILPIWHNIAREEVAAQSPLMASVYAARSSDGIDKLADQIAAVLRS